MQGCQSCQKYIDVDRWVLENVDVVWRVIRGHEIGVALVPWLWAEKNGRRYFFVSVFVCPVILCGEEENQLLFTEMNKLIYPTCS